MSPDPVATGGLDRLSGIHNHSNKLAIGNLGIDPLHDLASKAAPLWYRSRRLCCLQARGPLLRLPSGIWHEGCETSNRAQAAFDSLYRKFTGIHFDLLPEAK